MVQLIEIRCMDRIIRFDLRNNTLNKSSIRSALLLRDDAVVSLYFEFNERRIFCPVNKTGTTFLLPEDFSTFQFFVESNQALGRPATSRNQRNQTFVVRPMNPYYPSVPSDPAPTSKAFSKWMFFIHNRLGIATAICIHPRFFVSSRHGSNLQLKIGETLKIYTAEKEVEEQVGIHVTVVKVNEELDFVLFKSECNVVEQGPSIARAQESEPFTLGGIGDKNGGLSYLPGTIHSVRDIYFDRGGKHIGPFILGTGPSSQSDLGGAIWGSRGLIGLNYGCTTMTFPYHHLSSSEAARFSVKNILICPAFQFKDAYMEELEKERKEEQVGSPPRKKHCFMAEFEGRGTFYRSSE